MREMGDVHRWLIKVHSIVDVKSKNLPGIGITTEQVRDGEVFRHDVIRPGKLPKTKPLPVISLGAQMIPTIFSTVLRKTPSIRESRSVRMPQPDRGAHHTALNVHD